MATVLREGDRVVDVGANIGMITRLASRLVGPLGMVDAFEPNPICVQAIRDSIALNGITNIQIHQTALGEAVSILPLTVPHRNSGEATLVATSAAFAGEATAIEVPVSVGDEVIREDSRPLVFVKVDVEGFECQVLAGMRATLSKHRPIVVTEVVASHLARDSRTPGDIFQFMESLGYQGRNVTLCRRRLLGRTIETTRASVSEHGDNVLWDPVSGMAAERLSAVRHS